MKKEKKLKMTLKIVISISIIVLFGYLLANPRHNLDEELNSHRFAQNAYFWN